VLDVPQAARVHYLAGSYGRQDAGGLASAVLRLRKRLGGLVTKEALGAIADGDMPRMVELVLAYYDKTYGYGLADRPAVTVAATGTDAAANAALVLAAAREGRLASSANQLLTNDSEASGGAAHQ